MGTRRPRIVWHTAAGAVVAAYLLAAAVVVAAHAVVPVPEWLALHLLVLGAATNAVFVWSRFFAQALLHARPGSERPAHLRLGVLNIGVVAVLSGITSGLVPLAIVGAALVVGAVIAHAGSLLAMTRSSPLAGPLAVVAWYYVAAGAALAAGGTLGGVLAADSVRSPGLDAALVLAHAEVNLLGWLGLAIIGTQFMLWPMVLRTRMSDDAPRVARRVLVLTAGGLAVTVAALLASPYLACTHWLAAAGMGAYLAGTAASLLPAAREMRARPPHTAPAWALLAGNCLAGCRAHRGHRGAGRRPGPGRTGTRPAADPGPGRRGGRPDPDRRADVPAPGDGRRRASREPAADRDPGTRLADPRDPRQRRGACPGCAARRRLVPDRGLGRSAGWVRHVPRAGRGRAGGSAHR